MANSTNKFGSEEDASAIDSRRRALLARGPEHDAVIVASLDGTRRTITRREFGDSVAAFKRGCEAIGVARGDKVLFWTYLDEEAFALLFALFSIGAIPVFVDPATRAEELRECLREIQPDGFVGLHRAHLLRLRFRAQFASLRYSIVGRRFSILPMPSYRTLRRSTAAAVPPRPPGPPDADPAEFIAFTTGTTGKPKGVVYTRSMLEAGFPLWEGFGPVSDAERDISFIPVFSLLQMCNGVTPVIIQFDPRRPISVDIRYLVRVINELQVTRAFASPRVTERLAGECLRQGWTLPSLRLLMIGGAAVDETILRDINRVLPNGQAHVFYGCSEALPISLTPSRAIVEQTPVLSSRGERGSLVGRPLSSIQARVVAWVPPDRGEPPADPLPPHEVGELIVAGPSISRGYLGDERSTRRSGVHEGSVRWHRSGDLAYRDADDNLYVCGRAVDRIEYKGKIYLPIPVERVFDAHPSVFRSALLPGAGGAPAIAIEPVPGKFPRSTGERARLESELRDLASSNPLTSGIERFEFSRGFPTDSRHNSKIDRRALAAALRILPGPVGHAG